MQRLVLFLAIAAIAAIGVASWIVQSRIQATSVADLEQSLHTVLDATHQAMRSWAKQHKAGALAWASTEETRQATVDLLAASRTRASLLDSPAQTRLRAWLRPVVEANAYRGYALIGPSGQVLAASREADIGSETRLADQLSFLERIEAGETAVSLPHVQSHADEARRGAPRRGVPEMLVGAPVRDAAGRVVAALSFEIDPSEDFTTILRQGRIGVTGETYAFDDQGRLLSESRFEDQLRAIGLLSPDAQAALTLRLRDPGGDLTRGEGARTPTVQQPLTLMARHAIAGAPGSNMVGYRDYRGVLVVGAWLWDPRLGFGLTTELDRDEAFSVLDFSLEALSALTLFCSLLVVGLTSVYIVSGRKLVAAGRRLRRIVDLVPDMIVVSDHGGRILLANQAFSRACAIPVESLLEADPKELQGRSGAAAALLSDHGDARGDGGEPSIHRKDCVFEQDGEQRTVQRARIAYQPEGKERDAILTVASDVTQRKQMEIALRESEQLARSVLQSLPAHIAVLDGCGTITDVNSAWEQFGRDNGEPEGIGIGPGVNYLEVCRRARAESVPEATRALAGIQSVIDGSASSFTLEYPCHAPDRARWFLLSASPMVGERSGAVVSHLDISERKRAELELTRHRNHLERVVKDRNRELYLSEQNLRSVVESALGVLLWLSPEGRIVGFNREAERLYGKSQAEVIGEDYVECLVPDGQREIVSSVIGKALQGCSTRNLEYSLVTAAGGERALTWSLDRTLDPNGACTGIIAVGLDITARKQAEERLELAQRALENSADAIMVTDRELRIVEINEALCTLTGYARDELMGQTPRILTSGHHDKEFYRNLWRSLHETGRWQGELWDRRKDGQLIPSLASISAVRDSQEEVRHYVAVFSDITIIKETERRLEHLAHFDQLTGLPNRMLFHDRLRAALARAHRDGKQCAVLYVDLDSFKEINDTLGHQGGDQLLATTAQRLEGVVREHDTVARLGGDEFAVILDGLGDVRLVQSLATRVLDVLGRELTYEGKALQVSASVGVALYPNDGDDVETILRHADHAMYYAKHTGKSSYRFFEPKMNAHLDRRRRLESALRAAMGTEELFVQYQPKVDLSAGRVVGVEALLRWIHPKMGSIAPAQFISLAEETGLIVPLGRFVMEEACRAARQWQDDDGLDQPVAVNLSARQFRHDAIVADVQAALESTGLAPRKLELEITEGLLMDDIERTTAVLVRLKEMGVRIAMDDFGSGYSSLSYLKKLPVDVLKIDRSFLANARADTDEGTIVSAIISMAHSLKHTVIAEGVEKAEQMHFLMGVHCDEAQGFFISPPVCASELNTAIRRIEELTRGILRSQGRERAAWH